MSQPQQIIINLEGQGNNPGGGGGGGYPPMSPPPNNDPKQSNFYAQPPPQNPYGQQPYPGQQPYGQPTPYGQPAPYGTGPAPYGTGPGVIGQPVNYQPPMQPMGVYNGNQAAENSTVNMLWITCFVSCCFFPPLGIAACIWGICFSPSKNSPRVRRMAYCNLSACILIGAIAIALGVALYILLPRVHGVATLDLLSCQGNTIMFYVSTPGKDSTTEKTLADPSIPIVFLVGNFDPTKWYDMETGVDNIKYNYAAIGINTEDMGQVTMSQFYDCLQIKPSRTHILGVRGTEKYVSAYLSSLPALIPAGKEYKPRSIVWAQPAEFDTAVTAAVFANQFPGRVVADKTWKEGPAPPGYTSETISSFSYLPLKENSKSGKDTFNGIFYKWVQDQDKLAGNTPKEITDEKDQDDD